MVSAAGVVPTLRGDARREATQMSTTTHIDHPGALRVRRARFSIVFPICLGLLTFLAGTASAGAFGGGSWRCGKRLVLPGMSQGEVLALCGEPDSVSASEVESLRRHRRSGVVIIEPVETWTYNPGSKQLVRYLTFRGGDLVRIATGHYGY
jgi:hypothetical protein